MKLQGILGKGTGKLGNAVFAVSGGEQIMREYNPNVSNPNTEKQVAQRAKLKLMSQLAASLSSVIAIPKQGLVSSRNLFIKENIGNVTFEDGVASIDYGKLKLTTGRLNLGVVTAERLNVSQEGGSISINLGVMPPASVKGVMFIDCFVTPDKQLQVNASELFETDGVMMPGVSIQMPANVVEREHVCYAYGIEERDGGSSAAYENYACETAEDLAKLVTSRASILAGATLSATSGVILNEI